MQVSSDKLIAWCAAGEQCRNCTSPWPGPLIGTVGDCSGGCCSAICLYVPDQCLCCNHSHKCLPSLAETSLSSSYSKCFKRPSLLDQREDLQHVHSIQQLKDSFECHHSTLGSRSQGHTNQGQQCMSWSLCHSPQQLQRC